jgi:nucleoside-diphosphate-sugar epimerase
MDTVVVTGAWGLVGEQTLRCLLAKGYRVVGVDLPTSKARRKARRLEKASSAAFRPLWGDLRRPGVLDPVLQEAPIALIHLAAIIPPLADKCPDLAYQVNVMGTRQVLASLERSGPETRLVFSSSIATYGDRVANPLISPSDPQSPNSDDHYAQHKVECEGLIRAQARHWVICRLSYIVSAKKLKMDPLMFRMPLSTSLEPLDSRDTALALANAATGPAELEGRTFLLAGGQSCRTSYREYLDTMLRIFGLGGASFIPEEAFASRGYHCGFMDTAESQAALAFQTRPLAAYYDEVASTRRLLSVLLTIARPLARRAILARSPYLRAKAAAALRASVEKKRLARASRGA